MTPNKLGRFKQMILRRRVPHTLFSWRFLLRGQSAQVRLHRAVFLRAWAQFPRWVWGLVWVYSSLLWLGWYSWKQVAGSYRVYSQKARSRYGVSLPRQLLGLLNLALLHGIPPVYYYRYGLFRQQQRNPFAYIYTHELPHWHRTMCGNSDIQHSIELLGDKQEFAQQMSAIGLPVIESLVDFHAGGKVLRELIFTAESCFFKPRTGNRMRGCFKLNFDAASRQYALIGEYPGEDPGRGEDAIHDYIQQQVEREDYIMQPLLQNHPQMESMCDPHGLITLRVVTAHDGARAVVISAIMEIPKEEQRGWDLRKIDHLDGVILGRSALQSLWASETDEPIVDELAGCSLPKWPEVRRICRQAHAEFADVTAIGWDIAITSVGVVIIEGNFNWRVDSEQLLSGAPLLNTRLETVYLTRLSMKR